MILQNQTFPFRLLPGSHYSSTPSCYTLCKMLMGRLNSCQYIFMTPLQVFHHMYIFFHKKVVILCKCKL